MDEQEKEYNKKYVECNTALKRLKKNLVIDLGKFSTAIIYILQHKINKPTTLYTIEYGEIEFSVGVIRFKLQFQPKNPGVKLWCKHLEGMVYIDTRVELSELEPIVSLVNRASEAIDIVKPFDG